MAERRPTYKTLDEQEGRPTEAEERFERGRRTVGLFLGPLVFLALLALPLDLDGKQQGLAAVLGLVVVWWITEAIPIPITGLDLPDHHRLRVHRGGHLAVHVQHAAAVMLPIALGVMASVGKLIIGQSQGEDRPERLRFGAALMLVITYGITIGGLLLPIGSPPNLIGRSLIEDETGEPITFFEWFLMALPIVVVMFVALLVIILWLNRPEVKRVEGVVAVLAAGLLFMLPVDWDRRQFTLTWNQAARIDRGMILRFGANYGFMLPVSTPPNAIVYSSGMLPIIRMVKTGAVFDVIGADLCVVGVAIMANVVGLV